MLAFEAAPRAVRESRQPGVLPEFLTPLALAFLLSACGGGGGEVASTPAPRLAPPTPAPTPPTRPPLPAGPLGLTGGPFVTVAAEFDGISGEWPSTTTQQVRTGANLVTISYSATDNSYTLALPGIGQGKLVNPKGSGSSNNSTQWIRYTGTSFDLVGPDGQMTSVHLRYPTSSDLSYTSTGSWYSGLTPQRPLREGVFAYGLPTAAGTMPTSGTASYSATIDGRSATSDYIWGSALFNFDFGSSLLSGNMKLTGSDGWDPVDLGTFTFRDTVYSRGSTVFSGRLSVPSSTDTGSFAGQFTGPGGAELMGSFRTPAYNSVFKRWEDVAGVFSGKRQ